MHIMSDYKSINSFDKEHTILYVIEQYTNSIGVGNLDGPFGYICTES